MRCADKLLPGLNSALRAKPPPAVYLLWLDCRDPLLQRLDATAVWAASSPGQQLAMPSLCTESLLSISLHPTRSGDRTAGANAVPGRVQ